MHHRRRTGQRLFVEQVEPRYLMAVFAQDQSFDPPGPFSQPSSYFIDPVSKGRFLVAGGVEQPGDGDGGPTFTFVSRLLSDGSLDKTFGIKGQLNFGDLGVPIFTGSRILYTGGGVHALTVNGKPDESFGTDGIAAIPLSIPAEHSGYGFEDSDIIHTYDDGKLLIFTPIDIVSGNNISHQYQITRLNADGSSDTTFGDQGRLIFNSKSGEVDAFLTSTGLYVHVEFGFSTTPPSAELDRYHVDGKALDKSFGTKGKLAVPAFSQGFTEQPDGKLLFIADQFDQTPTLYRINKDGTPDTTFSSDGKIPLSNPHTSAISSNGPTFVLDDQGRITVAASATLFRFSSNGTLDAYPFDGTAPFPGGAISYDDHGRILVGGPSPQRYALLPSTQLDAQGIAHVTGTNDADTVTVAPASGGKLRFNVNGEITDLTLADVKGIDIEVFDGNNNVNVGVDLPTTVVAAAGDDSIVTGNGNDRITTGDGAETVQMGDGDDTLTAGSFGKAINVTGGDGNKSVSIAGGTATINLGVGDDDISTSVQSSNNVVHVAGGSSKFQFSGPGSELTIGGDGDNNVAMFDGVKSVTTGDGNDTLIVLSNDVTIHSGGGDDDVTLRVNGTDKGPTIFTDAGDDRVESDATFQGVATVYGGDGNDTLLGGDDAQALYGEGGKDSIDGGAGDDYISAGGGNDSADGEAGNDLIYGGPGDDTIHGNSGNDNLSGQDGRDHIYGGDGNDRIYGGAAGDSLYTNNGNDRVYGQGGDDRIFADYAQGRDTLYGGAGNDQFVTKDGLRDLIFGEGGTDRATADPIDVLTSIEL